MFQHVFFAKNAFEHFSVLLDDGREGDDVDDALQSMFSSVMQGERHRSQRFAAARWHGKRKEAWRFAFPLSDAGVQDFIPLAVDVAGGVLELLQALVQFFVQSGDVVMLAARLGVFHVGFGFLKVGIHQRRVNHARQERERKPQIIFGRLLGKDG